MASWTQAWKGWPRSHKRGETSRVVLNPKSGPAEPPPPIQMVAGPYDYHGRVFSPAQPWGEALYPPPYRVPRLLNPGIQALAGLSSVDAVHQTDHGHFLPPLAPPQRGGEIRSVAGGDNRQRNGAGLRFIPAAFIPLGH